MKGQNEPDSSTQAWEQERMIPQVNLVILDVVVLTHPGSVSFRLITVHNHKVNYTMEYINITDST